MTDVVTNIESAPTSFGTLKPVGHVLLALADAETQERMVAGLRDQGINDANRISPRETAEEMRELIDASSAAAGFGYEINLMRRYLSLAERGARWLLVKVDGTDDAAKVGELARNLGALSAVHYRRLIEEDLLG